MREYSLITSGPGRAFVLTPGGALLGCVEKTTEYTWKIQLTGNSEHENGSWTTRKEAARELIKRSLRVRDGRHIGVKAHL